MTAADAPELLLSRKQIDHYAYHVQAEHWPHSAMALTARAAHDWRDVAADWKNYFEKSEASRADLAAKLAAAERERDLAWTRFDKTVATLDEVALGRARVEAALVAAEAVLAKAVGIAPSGRWRGVHDALTILRNALPIPAAKPEGE